MNDSNTPKIVTMRDIGRTLGVSHVTVSLALRNHKSIPERHRLLIQARAQEMGYSRNAAATALARFRALARDRPINSTIAWLNFWNQPEKLRSYGEFDAYWNGANEAAEKLRYRIEEFICNEQHLESLADLLVDRGIEAILLPPQDQMPHLDDFPWEKFAAVRFGRSVKTPNLHVVTADQLADAILAFQKIKELGYHRIGFVSGRSFSQGAQFQVGYTIAQNLMNDEEALPVLCFNDSMDRKHYQGLLESWIRNFRPDAIITDVATIPEMVESAGYKIPDDIAIAATSVLDGKSDTGINQNSLDVGRIAVQMLISLLHHGDRGIPGTMSETLVHGKWIQGRMVPDRSNLDLVQTEQERC